MYVSCVYGGYFTCFDISDRAAKQDPPGPPVNENDKQLNGLFGPLFQFQSYS